MTKSFTNGELEKVVAAIEQTKADEISLPPKIAYKIIKNTNAIKQALQPYNLTRDEIIKQKTGGKNKINYNEDPQIFTEVLAAIGEIASETVQVDVDMIKLDELPDSNMPLAFIDAIKFMIEE
jgi:hypothetical protein